ncbi:MAG: ABC transporter substrate-binding protein [Chloroflexi bacterium]|nr:ABC transporter substrate-binding protein [Chloroflexota bacterium]
MRILAVSREAAEIVQALGLRTALLEASDLDGHLRLAGGEGRAEGDGRAVSHGRVRADGRAADVGPLRERVAALRPDLIFVDDAGSGRMRRLLRRVVAGLRPRPHVYVLSPRTVGDILSDVKTVGDATGRPAAAREAVAGLRERIDTISLCVAAAVPRRTAWLVSLDPPCAAGWWQAELLGLAGGLDVFDGAGRPPRAVSWREVAALAPEIIVGTSPNVALYRDTASPVASASPARPTQAARGTTTPELQPRAALALHVPTDPEPFLVPGLRVAAVIAALASLFHPTLIPPTNGHGDFSRVYPDA